MPSLAVIILSPLSLDPTHTRALSYLSPTSGPATGAPTAPNSNKRLFINVTKT